MKSACVNYPAERANRPERADALSRRLGRPLHGDPRSPRMRRETVGLVLGFISGREEVRCVASGRLVANGLVVRRDGAAQHRPCTPARRGICSGLSKASRGRLLRKVAVIDWAAYTASLVTLTYHLAWPENAAEWKAQLKAWLKRLIRRYGKKVVAVLWRLEQQKRGAPHFHLVVFWRSVPEFAGADGWVVWLSRSWHEIAGEGSPEHLRAGTQTQAVQTERARRQLCLYLSKYLSKDGGRWIDRGTGEIVPTGRVWGIWGKLPTKTVATVAFPSWAGYVRFVRRLRRYGAASGYLASLTVRRTGYLVFGDPDGLVQLFRGLDVQRRE